METAEILEITEKALRRSRRRKFIDHPFHDHVLEHSIELRNNAYDAEESTRRMGLKTLDEALDVPMANAAYYYTAGEYAKSKRALADAAAVCLRGIEFLDKEEKKQR